MKTSKLMPAYGPGDLVRYVGKARELSPLCPDDVCRVIGVQYFPDPSGGIDAAIQIEREDIPGLRMVVTPKHIERVR